jgi:hypothetical protein
LLFEFTSISPISDFISLASTFRGNRRRFLPTEKGRKKNFLNCFSARSLSPFCLDKNRCTPLSAVFFTIERNLHVDLERRRRKEKSLRLAGKGRGGGFPTFLAFAHIFGGFFCLCFGIMQSSINVNIDSARAHINLAPGSYRVCLNN